MTDRKQFEAMLEALINEDQETAKEIFHNIVVAKSREIYEELLAEDFDISESDKDEEDEDEEDKDVDEAFGGDEESADDEGDDAEDGDVGGDATDDFVSDVSADDEEEGDDHHDDVGGDEELEDRVMDLEDALDELKAEFEELMASDDAGDDMGADDMGADDMGADDMGGMDDMGSEEDDMFAKEMSQMMEYVNKINPPKHGDNGVNSKSAVAGKNDMGGTTANIARGNTEKGVEANKGNLKGNGVFKGGPAKEDNAGNVNVPGAKSATKLSSVAAGHGAEKKGKGEQAAYTKPIIGGK
jgi:hypothetical protein